MMADPYEDFNMTMAFAPNKYKEDAIRRKEHSLAQNTQLAKNAPGYIKATVQGLHDGALNTGMHLWNAANNAYQVGVTAAQSAGRLGTRIAGSIPYTVSYDQGYYGTTVPTSAVPYSTPVGPRKTLMTPDQVRNTQYNIDAAAIKARDYGHYANNAVQEYYTPRLYDRRNVEGAPSLFSELGTNTLMAAGGMKALSMVPGAGNMLSWRPARTALKATGGVASMLPWGDRVFGLTTDAQGNDAQWTTATKAVNSVLGENTVVPGDLARWSRTAVPAFATAVNPGMAMVSGVVANSGSVNPVVHTAGQYVTGAPKDMRRFPAMNWIKQQGKQLYDNGKAQVLGYMDYAQMFPEIAAQDAKQAWNGAVDWWNSDSTIDGPMFARLTGVYPTIGTPTKLVTPKGDKGVRAMSALAQGAYASNPGGFSDKPAGQIAQDISAIDQGVRYARQARAAMRTIGMGIQAYNTGKNIYGTLQGDSKSFGELASNAAKNYAIGWASDPANWVRGYEYLRGNAPVY